MQEIREIRVHPEHKKEIKKAAEFLIGRGWATDPVVVTEDETDLLKELRKDSTLWSFVHGFVGLDFYGRKSHIMQRRWFDDEVYYWFVLRLPIDPDGMNLKQVVDYIVIDREALRKLSADDPIEWLLKEF